MPREHQLFKVLRRCLLLSLLALSTGPANAAVLTLEQVLARAVAASHDVRLSEVDVKLNKNDVLRKRTDYLPNIVAHMNTEYLRDLTNDQTQVAVVNNTIIPNTTRYQTSINFATSWNVIDLVPAQKQFWRQKSTWLPLSTPQLSGSVM